jgi:hypothetical protein
MMNRARRASWSGLLVIVLLACGCELTTANISGLTLSKDKEGTVETTTFAPGDTVYARATVSNVPSPVTLLGRLIAEKVEGNPENLAIPNSNVVIEMPDDGVATFNWKRDQGWPPGKYRVEIRMLVKSGAQKDQKEATFTVAR